VRTAEATCPFCAASLSDLEARIIPNVTKRLSRGAVFVFAASSLAVAGCGSDESTTSTPPTDAQTDSNKTDTNVGDSPADSPDTNAADSPADSPVDTLDTGGVAPPYGIPGDSGPPDEGGGSADYGAPPTDASAGG